MSFNPTKLNAIRTSLNEAIKAVEEEHGVQFKLGKMSYSTDNFTMKTECLLKKGPSSWRHMDKSSPSHPE